MISKTCTKRSHQSKYSESATKILQKSNSKNTNLSNTYLKTCQNPQHSSGLKKPLQKVEFSDKKAQSHLYSKSKSETSFAKSQKKSVATKSSQNEKQSLSRLIQKSTCQKHQLWFNYDDQYPFKSQVKAQMSTDIYPDQKWQKSKEEKFQRLIQDLRKKHTARFEQKVAKQTKFMEKACPFIPNKQKVLQQSHNPEIHQSLFQRFKEFQQMHRLNEQQKIMQQKQLIEDCERENQRRFNESKQKWDKLLNSQAKKHHYDKPIHQRLQYIQKDKKVLIENLNEKYSQKESPLTNAKLNQEESKELVKRLCDDYRIKKKQNEAEREQVFQRQMKLNYPFMPIVNQTDLHRQNISPPIKKMDNINKENFTFAPKIDDMSKIIAQKLFAKFGARQQHYFLFPSRLSEGSHQKKAKIDLISKQVYSECTFKPEINQISKELVYVKNYQGQPLNVHKCPLPQIVIQEEKQLTFKPEINSQSKCMTLMEREEVLVKVKQRSNEKLEKIENKKQYKEMQQCTFKPKTVSTSADWKVWKEKNLKKQKLICIPDGGVGIYSDRENPQHCETVKGLNKFIKNCEKIKKKKENHTQRLKKIFNFEQRYDERIRRQRLGVN